MEKTDDEIETESKLNVLIRGQASWTTSPDKLGYDGRLEPFWVAAMLIGRE